MQAFELVPNPKPKKWKKGAGTVAYADDGRLFINSELIGMSAETAFLCCSCDGTGFIASGKRVLVPIDWAINEKPALAELVEQFARMAGEAKNAT
jgi:hypothetical protein